MSKSISKVFNSSGIYTITVSVMCTFVDSLLRSANAVIEALGVDPCQGPGRDLVAGTFLAPIPTSDLVERGAPISCVNGLPVVGGAQTSNDSCEIDIIIPLALENIGRTHTHPQLHESTTTHVTCMGIPTPLTPLFVVAHNEGGLQFSPADKEDTSQATPNYLRNTGFIILRWPALP